MASSKTINYAQLCDIVREIWMRSESEMVPQLRPVMPGDLFKAAIKGNSDVLIPRLGLEPEQQREIRVNIEDSDFAHPENQTVQSELQSATPFGDTILHILITEGHNKLALKVFECDESLLKARNNMLETPLYCAVKVGNTNVIDELMKSNCAVVKDELMNSNCSVLKDEFMKSNCAVVKDELMKSNCSVVKDIFTETNQNGYTALHVAIIKGCTVMVQKVLKIDPNLACTQFPNGMFPVHEAARMGHLDLVIHFMHEYPDDAELRDPFGSNFFHIAAEKNEQEFFNIAKMEEIYFEGKDGLRLQPWREMIERMITAQNYEGNTPLHIAAMKGNSEIMRAIWEHYEDAQTVSNKQGYTPLVLSAEQVKKANKDINKCMINKYLKDHENYKFTRKWFLVVMAPPLENTWERTQVIGLGSVLITTVAFAAAFTLPGGYNQDDGTPVLGRRHMFQAFILANTLAFLQGFVSLFTLILNGLRGQFDKDSIPYATYSFLYAASSMVVAFGLGLYVTLAPVSYTIAVLLLVITLIIGSPAVIVVVFMGKSYLQSATMNSSWAKGGFLLPPYAVSLLIIFCLPFM